MVHDVAAAGGRVAEKRAGTQAVDDAVRAGSDSINCSGLEVVAATHAALAKHRYR